MRADVKDGDVYLDLGSPVFAKATKPSSSSLMQGGIMLECCSCCVRVSGGSALPRSGCKTLARAGLQGAAAAQGSLLHARTQRE